MILNLRLEYQTAYGEDLYVVVGTEKEKAYAMQYLGEGIWGAELKLAALSFTTSNAAIFSDTNNTFLPSAMASAMIFVIVWLFPVPGGPCNTKLTPLFDSKIASCWLESASTT